MVSRETLEQRARLTKPDYITHIPEVGDRDVASFPDHQHFLVFDGPDGSPMAVWTLTRTPGMVNSTLFARSEDEGLTWSAPEVIAGPKDESDPTPMTNWAFPMVSEAGRIYVLWNQGQGVRGWIEFHTGTMSGMYSDDCGRTWSAPQDIPMPKSPYDDPEGKTPGEWIVWQVPERDSQGHHFVGYTRWVNRAVAGLEETADWTEIESVCEFMRFVNLDERPEPRDLDVRYSAWGDRALRVPHRLHPHVSVAQEPSLVRLPDERLFCAMRTCTGYLWWSQSEDDGQTWTNPRPLLYHDHGRPLLNPVGSAPIYRLSDGRYVIFYHNNRGGRDLGGINDATPREPLYLSVGEYRPSADQPLWFSPPRLFMATQGIGRDNVKREPGQAQSGSLSMYSSFTSRSGNDVLWYPDSKFFLLGRKVTPELLEGLEVPGVMA